MPLTPEQKKQAITLNGEGFAHFQIGEMLGVDRKVVATYLQSRGLKSPYISSNIIDLGNGMVECTKCGRELPREELPWGRVTKWPYQLSYCRQCTTAAAVANSRKSLPQYLKHRQRALKSRARESGIPYELPGGYLAELYERQGGKCFYTDEEMKVYFGTKQTGARRDSLSVDKIIPERGYVVGNVVLCIARANAVKHDCSLMELSRWMPGWYRRIIKFWKSMGVSIPDDCPPVTRVSRRSKTA